MQNNIVMSKIIELLNVQGKSQKELTDFLGITQNAFTDWKAGRLKSYTKHLPSIAKFLNVSVEYLMGETEDRSPDEPKLTEGEEMWLELYHLLTDESKAILCNTIPTLRSLPKEKKATAAQSFLQLLSSLQ